MEQKQPIRLQSAPGARKARKRVGRGAGSTHGSTCGRGDKGQRSRSGGGVRSGFEGGQMPLQRRLPKRGFASRTERFTEQVRTADLARFAGTVVDLGVLREARLVSVRAKQAKVILNGDIEQAVTLKGLKVSAGARAAIETAKGKIEE